MIEVSSALMEDIDDVVALGLRGHNASENSCYQYDAGRAKLLCATLIIGKRTCLFVAKQHGKMVGILLGQEDEYGYCKLRYATDIAVYSEAVGAGRKLLARFAQWAFEERKVDQLVLGVSHGGKSAQQTISMYRRMGYKHVGGIFTKQREPS